MEFLTGDIRHQKLSRPHKEVSWAHKKVCQVSSAPRAGERGHWVHLRKNGNKVSPFYNFYKVFEENRVKWWSVRAPLPSVMELEWTFIHEPPPVLWATNSLKYLIELCMTSRMNFMHLKWWQCDDFYGAIPSFQQPVILKPQKSAGIVCILRAVGPWNNGHLFSGCWINGL